MTHRDDKQCYSLQNILLWFVVRGDETAEVFAVSLWGCVLLSGKAQCSPSSALKDTATGMPNESFTLWCFPIRVLCGFVRSKWNCIQISLVLLSEFFPKGICCTGINSFLNHLHSIICYDRNALINFIHSTIKLADFCLVLYLIFSPCSTRGHFSNSFEGS